MPRLLGVDVPGKKRIEYALRYIHGIGPCRAGEIIEKCGIDPAKKSDDLTADEIRQIVTFIQENYRVEGDLRREVSQNIRRLISIGSYRWIDCPLMSSLSSNCSSPWRFRRALKSCWLSFSSIVSPPMRFIAAGT